MSSQPRVNFNFAGQPGSIQPIQTTNQTNFVYDNRYNAPRTYSTINQYEVNRNADQALVGVATGQRQVVTQTRYVEPQRYQQTQVVQSTLQPTQYRQTTQFVQSGQPNTYVQGNQEIVQQVARPQYNKVYNSNYDQRKTAVSDVDPEKKKTCCSPICWALWGLLGLAALVLGLLFGLGVIGGWRGVDLDANLNAPNLNLQGPNINANINGPNVDVNGLNTNVDVNGSAPNIGINGPFNATVPSVDVNANTNLNGNLNGGVSVNGTSGVNGQANPQYTVVQQTTILNNEGTSANGTSSSNTSTQPANGTATTSVQQNWNTSFMYPPSSDETVTQPTTVQVSTQPTTVQVSTQPVVAVVDTQSHPSVAVDQTLGNTSFMYPPGEQVPAHKLSKFHKLRQA